MKTIDFAVARVETHTRASVGKSERHNERKNESYANMNVDLSQTHRNIHFKSTGDLTYNQYLDKLIDEGKVSLRGLKKDAKAFDELILDVNSGYFEFNGGYDYAAAFYESAFHFAEELYGEENIISAVMHADEINLGLSAEQGHPVYHYHLHVTALPVVEKKILWTKRCKDPALVGTVKEIVHQISHSKKWTSDQPLLDENGQPVLRKNVKPQYIASYSILQDKFIHYMYEHGFVDIVRGRQGSNTAHLSSLEYQIGKDQQRLEKLQENIRKEEIRYDPIRVGTQTMEEVEAIGKPTLLGRVQMSKDEYDTLKDLAKECVAGRGEITRLEEENFRLSKLLRDKLRIIQNLENQLRELQEKCKPYLQALEHFPDLIRAFMEELRYRFDLRQRQEELRIQPTQKKNYRNSDRDMSR